MARILGKKKKNRGENYYQVVGGAGGGWGWEGVGVADVGRRELSLGGGAHLSQAAEHVQRFGRRRGLREHCFDQRSVFEPEARQTRRGGRAVFPGCRHAVAFVARSARSTMVETAAGAAA